MQKGLAMTGVLAVALRAAALTVAGTDGMDALTLTFDAAADARELWCAWDAEDKGAGFAAWASSERVAVVAADETTLTVALPNDARRAASARFFLFAGGASYPCAYIRSTDRAYVDTGYRVGSDSAVSVDFVLEDVVTLQQRPFGAHSGTFVISAYINSLAAWSWAFIDGAAGNWTTTDMDVRQARTVFTIDGPNDRVSLAFDGAEAFATNMTSVVARAQRTQACDVPLYLMAQNNVDGHASNFCTMKFYGATIDEAGTRVRTYEPYVSEGAAGVRDAVAGTFLGNANTERGAFIPCGRGGDVSGAEAGEALDLDAVRGGPAGLETVYVNVASGKTTVFDGGATVNAHLVKVGAGTLVLEGTRTFLGDVIVSNGTIRADYETCGLKGTHLVLATSGASEQAYLQITGSAFTAPLADSGAGTVELRGYSGIVPHEQDITVDFGGDGRMLTRYRDGFRQTSLILVNNRTTKNSTFVNGVDMAGSGFEIKSGGSGKVFVTGVITNSAPTAGVLSFWGGNQVIVGTDGARARDIYTYQVCNHASTVVMSNATIEVTQDFVSGYESNNVARTTLVNCRKYALSGNWDYISGAANTTLTVDGGFFAREKSHLNCGYTGDRKGTLIVTNDAELSLYSIRTYPDGGYRQYGGTVTSQMLLQLGGLAEMYGGRLDLTGGDSRVASDAKTGPATFAMHGGTLYVANSKIFQIGAYNYGTFHQTGGDVSVTHWFSIGRYAGGVGRLNVHGGTLTHRNQNFIRIAENGTGVVSVANGGTFVDLADYSPISQEATGKGTAILSPDGTFETKRFTAGAAGRDSSVVFNGGTMRIRAAGYANNFLDGTISRVTVSPYGGAIDTNGKGDFTLSRALGPTTDAGDLSEALAHRWSFAGGSLADSVGGLTATVNGDVDLEDGSVRLKGIGWNKSNVNLGTDLLPTDGRGATIEVWVTPMSYRAWARVVDFGAGDGTSGSSVKDIYFSFNNNNSTEAGQGHFRVNGGGTDVYAEKSLMPGNTYHLAIVLDPQPDGTFLNTAYVHDPATGELIASAQGRSGKGWTLANVQQQTGCFLGRSGYNSNGDADARYHEVRVHHRPMTQAQVAASCRAGPDAVYYFRKKGEGTLTMTGANTYAVGTAVDGGTLKLASGATLPATEMWAGAGATLDLNGTSQTARELGGTGTVKGGTLAVTGAIQPGGRKTVGTLTVDGTALASGTLVIDVAADGTSDCLAATGILDLSKFALALGEGTTLDETKVYTIATAAGFTGTFAGTSLPDRRWRVYPAGTKTTLAYATGTVLMIR